MPTVSIIQLGLLLSSSTVHKARLSVLMYLESSPFLKPAIMINTFLFSTVLGCPAVLSLRQLQGCTAPGWNINVVEATAELRRLADSGSAIFSQLEDTPSAG